MFIKLYYNIKIPVFIQKITGWWELVGFKCGNTARSLSFFFLCCVIRTTARIHVVGQTGQLECVQRAVRKLAWCYLFCEGISSAEHVKYVCVCGVCVKSRGYSECLSAKHHDVCQMESSYKVSWFPACAASASYIINYINLKPCCVLQKYLKLFNSK